MSLTPISAGSRWGRPGRRGGREDTGTQQRRHERAKVPARAGKAPTRKRIAREPTPVARVLALVLVGPRQRRVLEELAVRVDLVAAPHGHVAHFRNGRAIHQFAHRRELGLDLLQLPASKMQAFADMRWRLATGGLVVSKG